MTSVSSPKPKNKLGQYFTPRPVADLMVSLAHTLPEGRALEPCSGEGVFVDALLGAGYADITAVEVDGDLAHHDQILVRNESFVSAGLEAGFDLVIGNPPYIRWRNLDEGARDELEGSPLWQEHFNSLSDYLTIFIARSVELLAAGGEMVFITPSFWMHTLHSASLRDFMLERGSITDVVHFGEATVFPGVGSSIIIFRYAREVEVESTRLFRYVGPRSGIEFGDAGFEAFASSKDVVCEEVPAFEVGKQWVLAPERTQRRLSRLEQACRVPASAGPAQKALLDDAPVGTLGAMTDIANGMVSGLDAAFRVPPGVKLNEDEKAATIQVAKGFALSPYIVTGTIPYVFVPEGLEEHEFEATYPTFASHLSEFRGRLENRYAYGRDLKYWEWAFLRSYKFFSSNDDLIFVPCKERLSNKDFLRFALAPRGSFPTQDVTAIGVKAGVKESPLYLLAVLNFPGMYEWVRYKGLMKGEVAEFSEKPLSRMPVRLIDWTSRTEVEAHDRVVGDVKAYLADGDERLRGQIAKDIEQLLFG